MAQAFDVCIRGSGIVGRSLALLLAQQRLKVALIGQQPDAASAAPGAGDVRAYALNAASRRLLQGLRCWPGEPASTAVTHMQVLGDGAGEVRFDLGLLGAGTRAPDDDALAWIVDVPALESCLADALRFQPQVEWLAQPVPATLTVVCEGRASQTRTELGVEFSTAPYGQHAIAARLQCEKSHGQQAWQWFHEGEILAFLPMGGEQGNSVALVWSVAEQRAPALCAASDEDFVQLLQAVCGETLGRLQLCSARASWPLQYSLAERWCGQMASGAAWALAGDAAHAVHPLAGQGLNLGLADAAELARCLAQRDDWRPLDDRRSLRRYERARRAELARMGLVMDGLQRLFALPGAPAQQLRNWGMQGFERSGPLKSWVARQAMGLAGR